MKKTYLFMMLWSFRFSLYLHYILWCCCPFSTLRGFSFRKCCLSRNSRPDVFCEKGVLRNFEKFTGKHLCQSLFFLKVAGSRPAILLWKRTWRRCFPLNCAKFLRTTFLTEHLWWLLLIVICIVIANTIIVAQRRI